MVASRRGQRTWAARAATSPYSTGDFLNDLWLDDTIEFALPKLLQTSDPSEKGIGYEWQMVRQAQ